MHMRISHRLLFFVESKTENQLTRFVIA